MQIESIEIEKLIFDPSNARKHNNKNIEAIKGSLAKFGQQKPVVIDDKNIILAGNGTVAAAKELGWKSINAVRSNLTSDVQKTAFAIADNRTAELADWDEGVLTQHLLSLQAEDFDLGDIGFDELDLKNILGDVIPPFTSIEEDSIPDDAPQRAKSGDIWQLGQHKLLCGDSSSPENIAALFQGEKCDMVFTDPPYRMEMGNKSERNIKNDPSGLTRASAKLGERIKDIIDFEPEAFLAVLPSVFPKGKMNAYIFCNKDLVPDYLNWGKSQGYSFNILVWKKPNSMPLGGTHRPDLEYLLVFRKSAIWNNGVEGVNYSKCLEFARDNSTEHPTMKPIGLIANELLISSNQGSLVVDFFLGSGSTLIAAEKTGRRCYGFEMDTKYCDIILQRWENASGASAERIREGKPSVALEESLTQ